MILTIQITTDCDDHFRTIHEEDLRTLFEIDDLERRRQALWNRSEPYSVTHTGAVDLVIVVDGTEDAQSWADLKAELDT